MRTKSQVWLYMAITFICYFALTNACTEIKPTTQQNVAIDSTLAQHPPTANEIFIRELERPTDAGNVLFSVALTGINSQQHAVMVGEEKLILHDDGEQGDEKAGDGIFSIILQEDLNQFIRETSAITSRFNTLAGKPLVKFVNRHAVTVPLQTLQDFRVDTSLLRKGIRLPVDFFTPVPDPMLRERSLMITDLKVVTDKTRTFNPCLTSNAGNPSGVWTFNILVTNMTNMVITIVSPVNFVRAWLDQWMNTQTINGDVITARKTIFNRVIVPWIRKTDPSANPTEANWKTFPLDLTKAPFKLEAIVNRLDLRENFGYATGNAGEGRFVFSVIDNQCNPLPFTVIFEYGIPKRTCGSIKAFAKQWFDLKNFVPGSPQYNNALQAVTDQFTAMGAGGAKPNGSALNQIRTNEVALGEVWELREFKINGTSHFLEPVVVANEPALKFNASAGGTLTDVTILANYVNTNQNDIIAGKSRVPLSFGGVDFQGAKAHTLTQFHIWNGEQASSSTAFIQSDSARHFMSLNTCSGCHGGEGATSVGNRIEDPAGVFHDPFLQIAPHPGKATLAAFLTGDPNDAEKKFRVKDPANRPSQSNPIEWTFNDLERRAQDLDDLANNACLRKLPALIHIFRFRPLNMVH